MKKPLSLKSFLYIVIGVLAIITFFGLSNNYVNLEVFEKDSSVVIESLSFRNLMNINSLLTINCPNSYILNTPILNKECNVYIYATINNPVNMGLQYFGFLLILLAGIACISLVFIKDEKIKRIVLYSIIGTFILAAIFIFLYKTSLVNEFTRRFPEYKNYVIKLISTNSSKGFVGKGIFSILLASAVCGTMFLSDDLVFIDYYTIVCSYIKKYVHIIIDYIKVLINKIKSKFAK